MRKRYNDPEIDYDTLIRIQSHEDPTYTGVNPLTYVNFICEGCKTTSRRTVGFKQFIPLCKACRTKKTCLEKYGVENPFQSDIIKDKIKETNLKNLGVVYNSQSDDVKKKKRETNLKRYGVECNSQLESNKEKVRQTCRAKYNCDTNLQCEETKQKSKQTCLEKYGVEYYSQCDEYKSKYKATCLERYGVDNPMRSLSYQEKYNETCMNNYGCKYPAQAPEVLEKIRNKLKQTMIDRYGVEYYSQTEESHKHRKTRIEYNNMFFDSKPELEFYISCLESGKTIVRHPVKLEYKYDSKVCYYFPDFQVDNELIEIKGSHFLNPETGKWYNPFDRSQDKKYEAKYDCAIRNRVRIIYV